MQTENQATTIKRLRHAKQIPHLLIGRRPRRVRLHMLQWIARRPRRVRQIPHLLIARRPRRVRQIPHLLIARRPRRVRLSVPLPLLTIVSVAALLLLALATLLPATAQAPLAFATFLGSDSDDQGNAIALDAAGNIYIAGTTQSTSFPTGILSLPSVHGVDAFVAKLDPTGAQAGYIYWFNALTLFAEDEALGIAVDAAGNAYVTGYTRSDDFCRVFGIVPGYDPTYNGETDAYLMKLRADGSGVAFCTFLGGSDFDLGRGVAVDAAGNIYVAGSTWSTDFPTTPGALQPALADQRDVFVARLDPAGAVLQYATYYGGSLQEEATGLATDGQGNVVVAGWTSSANFPTTPGALDTSYNGSVDGFLFRFSTTAVAPAFSTYLGGGAEDRIAGVRVDSAGRAVVAGATSSTDFPATAGALATALRGGRDGFVAQVSPAGNSLAYATYLGGSDEDWVHGLALDAAGRVMVTGATVSPDFPTTPSAYARTLAGERDAFTAQLAAGGSALLYGSYLGGAAVDQGAGVAVDAAGNAVITGPTFSADFPATPGAFDPQFNGAIDAFVAKLAVPVPPAARRYLPLVLSRY